MQSSRCCPQSLIDDHTLIVQGWGGGQAIDKHQLIKFMTHRKLLLNNYTVVCYFTYFKMDNVQITKFYLTLFFLNSTFNYYYSQRHSKYFRLLIILGHNTKYTGFISCRQARIICMYIHIYVSAPANSVLLKYLLLQLQRKL